MTASAPSAKAPALPGRHDPRRGDLPPSYDYEFGAQGAGFLQRLEDCDQVAGRGAYLIYRPHDLIQIHARVEHEHACLLGLLDLDRRTWCHDRVAAAAQRVRLTHILPLRNRHRE